MIYLLNNYLIFPLILAFFLSVEFLLYQIIHGFTPRIDLIVLFIMFAYFQKFPNIIFLFVFGIIRDVIYNMPMGVNSIMYICVFVILKKYQDSLALKDNFTQSFIVFTAMQFLMCLIQSIMTSIYHKQILHPFEVLTVFFSTVCVYNLVNFIFYKYFKDNSFYHLIKKT